MLAPEPHQPLHLTQQRRRGAILMDLADPSIDTELQDEAPPPDEGQAEEARQVAESLVIALGQELHQKFIKAKSDRTTVETRWHEDIAQYNGIYSAETKLAIESRQYGSKVFVPLTRRIQNVVEAKLGDLLFPTDDRNFSVEASPEGDMEDALALAMRLPADAEVVAGGQKLSAQNIQAALRDLREENDSKAHNMQRAIDDQLTESKFPTHARAAMHDALKLGSGIIKGPMVLGTIKKRWLAMEGGIAGLQRIESFAPKAVRVDPWNYYPEDLSVADLEAMPGHFERHPLNKAQLARLATQPGFRKEAIERVILLGPADSAADGNATQQREAAGTSGVLPASQYNLIEYNGSVDHDKMVAWGAKTPEQPLLVYSAVVWFSEQSGEVVKAIVNPMDTDDQPYCIFNWQRDTACVFGYGLPYELRDTQEAANGSFRALMDNMGLTVGPQVVVNDKKVVPANGRWVIEPNKVWRATDGSLPVGNVFGFYQINTLATELLAIFNTVKGVAEEIGGPAMAMQGSEAPSYMQAGATGVAMAFNAASVWMRRGVRGWDDQVTIPLVGRFIDWNMQYNPNDNVKGDLKAVAKGTSALLEAEGFASKLQVLAKLSAEAGVPIRRIIMQLRKVAVSLRLDPDELLPDDAEVRKMEEAAAKNGPPPNPEMERIKMREAELQDNREQRQHELQIETMRLQARSAEIASKEGLSIEEMRTKYGIDLKRESARMAHEEAQAERDTQMFNAELAMKATAGSGI